MALQRSSLTVGRNLQGRDHDYAKNVLLAVHYGPCGDDDGTNPPATGSIVFQATTTGDALDDSYGVSIDGSAAGTIGANASRTFSDQSPGSFSVLLTDVATNCAVTASNHENANVVAGQSITLSFSVQCAP
jgi:hypothetical protein